MKNLLTIFFLTAILSAKGDYWTQKSNYPGGGRIYTFSFSIGNKGYVGCGHDAVTTGFNDFWEFDPISNVWTQKANFAGNARLYTVGFSIGNKGYAGLGNASFGSNTALKEMWEYDASSNTWSQKADFIGILRSGASVFTLGSKSYIGMGGDTANVSYNDLWEFDPTNNIWTQKGNLPGAARSFASAFSINNKGYITAGITSSLIFLTDLWEYEAGTNLWTQKAFLPASPRAEASAFAICEKGYLGAGYAMFSGAFNDFWQYEPSSNQWLQKANVGGSQRLAAAHFSIGNKGYIGLGKYSTTILNDIWEYTPDSICATSIGENTYDNLHFTIWPNPATDFIQIKFTRNEKKNLEIVDIYGKIIYESSSSQTTISLKEFSKGIYFVVVSDDRHKVVNKFIKE